MRKNEGRWVDVRPENFVLDATGKMWKVLTWDHIAAVTQDKDGKKVRVRPDPYSEVTYYTRTINDAVKVITEVLGGTVIEEREVP